VQSAIRTPGKGTDRYWGKLGWRWRGLFIFREGAAAGCYLEGGSRGSEWKNGGGEKIRRCMLRIEAHEERKRRELVLSFFDQDPCCKKNIKHSFFIESIHKK